MKKILIISWYFPPANSIASNRPFSWAKEFPKYGYDTTVLTRHWKGDENSWDDFLKENNNELKIETNKDYRTIYLPYRKEGLLKLLSKNFFRKKFITKIVYSLLPAFGILDAAGGDAYYSFKNFIYLHLKENKYDCILVTALPINIVKLGYEASKQYNIPLFVDFRDVWGRWRSQKCQNRSLRQIYIDFFYQRYIRKWLSTASGITATSSAFLKNYTDLCNKPAMVVTNGFEAGLFDKIIKQRNNKFTFSVIGTLYPEQDLSILLEGLKRFINSKNSKLIQINFIGLKAIPKVAKRIEQFLGSEGLNITDRVSREEALTYTRNSEVIFYPGWKGYTGIYSGKIFEYLASGVNILIAPGDDDVIDELIVQTNSGKFANSVDEFHSILNEWYNEWETSGELSYKGNLEKVRYYTRENQAYRLATFIRNNL